LNERGSKGNRVQGSGGQGFKELRGQGSTRFWILACGMRINSNRIYRFWNMELGFYFLESWDLVSQLTKNDITEEESLKQ